MKAEILETVRKAKLSCQASIHFLDFMDINNGVAVCDVLGDDKLINATLGNNDDNGSDIEEVSEKRRQHSQYS